MKNIVYKTILILTVCFIFTLLLLTRNIVFAKNTSHIEYNEDYFVEMGSE